MVQRRIKNGKSDLLIFIFGFVLAVSTGVNLVGAAIIASMFALIKYQIEMSKAKNQSNNNAEVI